MTSRDSLAHEILNYLLRFTLEKQHDHCILYEDCDLHDESCDTCATGRKYCSRGAAPPCESLGTMCNTDEDCCDANHVCDLTAGPDRSAIGGGLCMIAAGRPCHETGMPFPSCEEEMAGEGTCKSGICMLLRDFL